MRAHPITGCYDFPESPLQEGRFQTLKITLRPIKKRVLKFLDASCVEWVYWTTIYTADGMSYAAFSVVVLVTEDLSDGIIK